MVNPRSDDFQEAAEALKDDIGAYVFVVEAGDEKSYGQDTQLTTNDKIIRIKQWRGTDSEVLGPIADMICKVLHVNYHFIKALK
ncbi:unnamed protein product [Strongylus vulgaris]|uniref:Uncharacterized protein n=1 Tax=Strongylus vulgaris TaxID=40348 RepID=A0A3P7IKY4_STRVU|nr:unnamed protein product [Strongylus vulgaris]